MNKIILASLIAMSVLFVSCGDDDKPTAGSEMTIISINPMKGAVGTPVLITGTNFPANKADLAVTFNSTSAIIDSIVGTSKIYVRVPAGASTGKISLTALEKTVQSAEPFTIINSTASLLPSTADNYWIYSKFQLDSLNNVIIVNPGTDSIVSAGSINKLGKNATFFKTFSKQNVGSEYTVGIDQFYYEENQVLFTHSSWFDDLMNFGGMGLQLPFQISEQWLKLIDPFRNDWTIYSRTFNKETFNFGTLDGELTLRGVNLGTLDYTLNNKLYTDTRRVDIVMIFNGSVNTQLGVIPLNLQRILNLWYAPGVGKLKAKMSSMPFIVPSFGINQVIPGYEQIISKYQIK